jgi:predicted GH43/DUF377 family glycosyl hydrolase
MENINRFAALAGVCLAALVVRAAENPLPKWALGGFVRPAGVNPVIRPNPKSEFECPMQRRLVKWEESDTFNPAAAVKDGKICVLYRAEDNTAQGVGSRTSRIGLAVSEDGVRLAREPKPVLFPGGDDQEEFDCPGGCEDPRISVTEDGLYVMTYTSWNRKCPRLCIATSRDLRHWTKHGPAFGRAQGGRFLGLASKSGAIVTEPSAKDPSRYVIAKIHGKYLMYWGETAIHAATSDDLVNWNPVTRQDGSLRELVKPRPGFFDSTLVEVGPAAIRTKYGIVVLYNGRNGHGVVADRRYGQGTYCGGQVLFDGRDPYMPAARLDEPYFRPLADFERKGQYAEGTVFTEGLVQYKGKWYLYYGCADSLVGVAVWDPESGMRVGDPLPEAE